MRAVNLLPDDSQPRKLSGPPLAPTLAVAGSVVAAGVIGVVAHQQGGAVTQRQQQLDALKERLAQVSTPQTAVTGDAVALIGSRTRRIEALNAALSRRVAYDSVMRQLALVLPDDVWLDGLQLAHTVADAAAAPATPGAVAAPDVTLTGYTYSLPGVARLVQRLNVVPTLTNIALTSAQIQAVGKKNVFHFTVNASFVQPGGPS